MGFKKSKIGEVQSSPRELNRLRVLLGPISNKAVLESFFKGSWKHYLPRDAFLVTINRTWLQYPPYNLTEIGIATYDKRQVASWKDCPPGPHAEDMLKHVWFMHLRIMPHAHLPTPHHEGDAFDFGTSVFVTLEEAHDMLGAIWNQYMDDERPDLGLRPIIYMSFADNDSLNKMRKHFDFDPEKVGTTVATLDAQTVAEQSRIPRQDCEHVEDIMRYFNIEMRSPDNSGNAAAYIAIAAFLSTLRGDLYQHVDNPDALPGQWGQSFSKSAQDVVDHLIEYPTGEPPFGITMYCWRCGSRGHMYDKCPETDFICSKCTKSDQGWRRANAGTHKEGLCIFRT